MKVEGNLYTGKDTETIPAMLKAYDEGKGYILSEKEVRRRESENSGFINQHMNTATLMAVSPKAVMVVLPYKNESRELTPTAKLWLEQIREESATNYGLGNHDLNAFNLSWAEGNRDGTYALNRKDEDMIMNRDLTYEEAAKHPLILTKLGHPKYVSSDFASQEGEVEAIIQATFEKRNGKQKMMGQYMPDVEGIGFSVLRPTMVGDLRVCNLYSSSTPLNSPDNNFYFEQNN